jgi:hypothetical protein
MKYGRERPEVLALVKGIEEQAMGVEGQFLKTRLHPGVRTVLMSLPGEGADLCAWAPAPAGSGFKSHYPAIHCLVILGMLLNFSKPNPQSRG